MWRIPLSDLNFDSCETDAVLQVLKSGWLTMGPRTREFETAFASQRRVSGAVAVANCTCALELTYRYIFQLCPGRRAIVVPDITFVATASAVISAGGIPILCDIDAPDRPVLSPAALDTLLSSRTDIAAVVVMHYAGYDAGAEKIAEICSRHQVYLVEDCAHAPAALTATGKPLGSIGLAGCFSFFSNKNLSTGEGGMITSNDQDLLAWTQMARSHGLTGSTWTRHETKKASYDVMFPGHNYRPTEITAALGITQLQKLREGNARRQQLTSLYQNLLEELPGIKVALADKDGIQRSDCHILPVLVHNPETKTRIVEAMIQAGIQTSHHYPPIHTFAWYSTGNQEISDSLQNAEAFAAMQLTLPLHPKLTEQDVHEVTSTVRSALT